MGKSSSHASSVGLIINLTTGYISPQFHVVYGCKFQTVVGGYEHNDTIATHIWESLVDKEIENMTADKKTMAQYPLDIKTG